MIDRMITHTSDTQSSTTTQQVMVTMSTLKHPIPSLNVPHWITNLAEFHIPLPTTTGMNGFPIHHTSTSKPHLETTVGVSIHRLNAQHSLKWMIKHPSLE